MTIWLPAFHRFRSSVITYVTTTMVLRFQSTRMRDGATRPVALLQWEEPYGSTGVPAPQPDATEEPSMTYRAPASSLAIGSYSCFCTIRSVVGSPRPAKSL